MQSVTETVENNQVKLVVEIPEAELLPEIESAFKKVSRQATLPGFRPGKAPRKVLEAKLGLGFARAEAINENANRWAEKAIVENQIEPISSPEIKVIEGEDTGDVKLDVIVEVRPSLALEEYGDLTINVPAAAATDEEIEGQLERLREALGTLEDSAVPVGPGSVVTLDLLIRDGITDPDELTDYVFRIGTEDPYLGLTEAITGLMLGANFEFVFANKVDSDDDSAIGDGEPLDEGLITVSGEVKMHQSLLKPDLDDTFAKDASEFETLEDLRADMRSNFDNFRSSMLRNSWRQILVNKLSELAGLEKLPESLVRMEFERLSHDFGHRIESSGLSFAKYLELANTTADEISTRIASDAVLETRYDLVLRALALAEGLEASEEELNVEVGKIAVASDLPVVDALERLKTAGQLVTLRSEIAKRKALDWVFDNVTFLDERGVVLDRALITGEVLSSTEDVAESAVDEVETK